MALIVKKWEKCLVFDFLIFVFIFWAGGEAAKQNQGMYITNSQSKVVKVNNYTNSLEIKAKGTRDKDADFALSIGS